MRAFSEWETGYFVSVDFLVHVALVAEAQKGDAPAIVGSGRFIVPAPDTAELAFASRMRGRTATPAPR
ncbi:hypothetical protein [Methylobacterium sp. WSM2598]|uniref:hypothetical protein n=1 Tax=Methylobacterium sp. WSM2598 TaxID=398261 RepID=UPI0003A2937A|nr:hypothetical protein [Methylobacterium sp. WSM2598]